MIPAIAPSPSVDAPKVNSFAISNRYYEIAISFLIGAGFFLLLQATTDIPGGTDGYRHVKQAWRLIHEPHAMFADPWHLAYFWRKPVDPWFGYHLLLVPFVYVFDLITAIKLLSSAIFGLTAYVLFSLLRNIHASCAPFWVLLAMTGSSMTLGRATTVRPFLLSVLLTLAAVLFAVTDKPVKLALVSVLHALSYSIFFLVGIGPALWFLLRRDRRSGRAALCCAGGMCLGLLANPYFPENLRFDLVQASVVSIARAAHVKIAPELYAADSWWTIAACLPAALPWVFALIVRFSRWREVKITPISNLFLLISSVMVVGTVQVVRTADFFIPFSIVFAAAMLSPYLKKMARADLAVIGLLFSIPCAINIYLTHAYIVAAPPLERFRGAAMYLKNNAPDALVVNTGWAPDYFLLFFFNSRSRYVIGIEPTFVYLTDTRKYWVWRHMNMDESSTCDHEKCSDAEQIDIVSAANKVLGAQYLVTDHQDNPLLGALLRASNSVKEVYRDDALSVFHIETQR
jgi:hypothetical protein